MKKILIPIGLLIALIIGVIMSLSRGAAESPTFMREVLPKQDGFASLGMVLLVVLMLQSRMYLK